MCLPACVGVCVLMAGLTGGLVSQGLGGYAMEAVSSLVSPEEGACEQGETNRVSIVFFYPGSSCLCVHVLPLVNHQEYCVLDATHTDPLTQTDTLTHCTH